MAIRIDLATVDPAVAALCQQVMDDGQAVIFQRDGEDVVAVVAAAELSSLVAPPPELRSPSFAELGHGKLPTLVYEDIEAPEFAEDRHFVSFNASE